MKKEKWGSHIGVILAVAGSAVGLGNFLKFPSQVAAHGGAAFMIAYVIAFFIIAMPLSIVEWTIGRQGGVLGYNSTVGIFYAITKNRLFKYLGVIGILICSVIFCYYVYLEAWCLGYAMNFLFGSLELSTLEESKGFFNEFTGVLHNGDAFKFSFKHLLPYFLILFFFNFYIAFKGISKGIEIFCKYAMPLLFIMGFILVVRVLTLPPVDADKPEQTAVQGLGFMWNPEKVSLEKFEDGAWKEELRLVGDVAIANAQEQVKESPKEYRVVSMGLLAQLCKAKLWIAATSQVFFSLTVGIGVITIYASYMRKKDDVVLSSVAAASTNEFAEICLGGLITVPAAVAFFGVAGVMGAGLSLFDLGFKTLPVFFSSLPFGFIFGFLFFGLLALGAITSSISMLQPAFAFLEEAFGLKRKKAGLVVFTLLSPILFYVAYFSKDLKVLNTMDFWGGAVLVYIFAIIISIIASQLIGGKKIVAMANAYSFIQLPRFSAYIIQYFTPLFLILIFVLWLIEDVFTGNNSNVNEVFGADNNIFAQISFLLILALLLIYCSIIYFSKNYNKKIK